MTSPNRSVGLDRDFSTVSERAGEPATSAQIADMYHRYRWAAECCAGRRVIDVACGTAQGLGLLQSVAASASGSDVDLNAVRAARLPHEPRLCVARADALPWRDRSADAILLFEALYDLPEIPRFLEECRRVLAPHGLLLMTMTNRDLADFVPSRLSRRYFGANDLPQLLARGGFSCELFGYSASGAMPFRYRALRPVKIAARLLRLLPTTMRGKARLRRTIFGRLTDMPADLAIWPAGYSPPVPVSSGARDRTHRFLYAVARPGS